jgi:NAD(P)-dependent dehydrogenase (short-subunit alcohol dehydrogenase family)
MAKVMLVTGGSRGIGAATCRLAARRGYDVAINYAGRADAAEAVAAEVEAAGRRALAIQADVSDTAALAAMFDRVEQTLGPVEAFVNNAGIVHAGTPLAELDEATIRRVIDVDLTAAILAAREAVRRMSRSRGGKGGVIVNTSSVAPRVASGSKLLVYGIAKGGIDVLTEQLGREVAGEGIRVCGVKPGLIDTEIHADIGGADRIAALGSTVPIGRAGTADEVAECILWLCSDHASYVTATSFDVAGGR